MVYINTLVNCEILCILGLYESAWIIYPYRKIIFNNDFDKFAQILRKKGWS